MDDVVDFDLARWGVSVRWKTGLMVGGSLLTGLILCGAGLWQLRPQPEVAWYLFFGAAWAIALPWLVWAWAPRRVRLTPYELVVSRALWPVPLRLPLTGFSRVERWDGSARARLRSGVVRVLGSQGVFGFWGLFHHHELGMFRACVTRMEDLVVLHGHRGRSMVVSPADPAGFAEAVRARLPSV